MRRHRRKGNLVNLEIRIQMENPPANLIAAVSRLLSEIEARYETIPANEFGIIRDLRGTMIGQWRMSSKSSIGYIVQSEWEPAPFKFQKV
jgi:hypothetical protein